jgi:hypothetical protein
MQKTGVSFFTDNLLPANEAAAKAARMVLVPFHISAFGRLHPIAYKFYSFMCARATARHLSTPRPSALRDLDPDARAVLHKRKLMRSLSISVQRSLVLGMFHAARSIVSPRSSSPSITSTTPSLMTLMGGPVALSRL